MRSTCARKWQQGGSWAQQDAAACTAASCLVTRKTRARTWVPWLAAFTNRPCGLPAQPPPPARHLADGRLCGTGGRGCEGQGALRLHRPRQRGPQPEVGGPEGVAPFWAGTGWGQGSRHSQAQRHACMQGDVVQGRPRLPSNTSRLTGVHSLPPHAQHPHAGSPPATQCASSTTTSGSGMRGASASSRCGLFSRSGLTNSTLMRPAATSPSTCRRGAGACLCGRGSRGRPGKRALQQSRAAKAGAGAAAWASQAAAGAAPGPGHLQGVRACLAGPQHRRRELQPVGAEVQP